MPDYEKMYFYLAGKVADAISRLTIAQQECEEAYINDDEEKPYINDNDENPKE